MTPKERIDQLRIKKGWSLNKLAQEIGVSDTTVYSWFRKKGFNPSTKTIKSACKAFGISLTEFYSCVDSNDITTNEMLLLNSFRNLSKEEQEKVLKIVKIFENGKSQ